MQPFHCSEAGVSPVVLSGGNQPNTQFERTSFDNRHLIEVKNTPEKRLGIFAKDVIPQGTRVLAETPLLRATIISPSHADVETAFQKLPLPAQTAYLQLHAYASESFKRENNWEQLSPLSRKVLAIYCANRWGRDVFQIASRFNHSCIPNIHNAYNPHIKMETFHSIREIEAGEELTISYLPGVHIRKQRQGQLKKWGFRCKCFACENDLSGRSIEEKLVRVATLNAKLELTLPGSGKQAIHQELAALLCSAGLIGKILHQCYLDAAIDSAILGNVRMAALWTEKEVVINRICIGPDHPDYQKELIVLDQLRNAVASKKPFSVTQIDWIMDWDQGPG